MSNILCVWLGLFLVLFPAQVWSQEPYIIWHGHLRDEQGQNINDIKTLHMAIYADQVTQSALYEQTQNIQVQEGKFIAKVGLGDAHYTPSNWAMFSELWLGVTIANDTEMRFAIKPMLGSLAAFRASNADTLDGYTFNELKPMIQTNLPMMHSANTVALAPCAAGEVYRFEQNHWACSSEVAPASSVLVQSPVIISNHAFALEPCEPGQLYKIEQQQWVCSNDAYNRDAIIAGSGLELQDHVIGLSSACHTGEVLRFDGFHWNCSPQLTSTHAYQVQSPLEIHAGHVQLISNCASGQILRMHENAWQCSDSGKNIHDEAQSPLILSNGQFSLSASCQEGNVLRWHNDEFICRAENTESLHQASGGLILSNDVLNLPQTCGTEQTLKYIEQGWQCANDIQTNIEYTATHGLHMNNRDLSLVTSCADGQLLKTIEGEWSCADDTDTLPPTYTANQGLVLNGTTLHLASCPSNGDAYVWSSNAWACSSLGFTAGKNIQIVNNAVSLIDTPQAEQLHIGSRTHDNGITIRGNQATLFNSTAFQSILWGLSFLTILDNSHERIVFNATQGQNFFKLSAGDDTVSIGVYGGNASVSSYVQANAFHTQSTRVRKLIVLADSCLTSTAASVSRNNISLSTVSGLTATADTVSASCIVKLPEGASVSAMTCRHLSSVDSVVMTAKLVEIPLSLNSYSVKFTATEATPDSLVAYNTTASGSSFTVDNTNNMYALGLSIPLEAQFRSCTISYTGGVR